MKILPVNLYKLPHFKGNNDEDIIAYDDAESKARREYIRNHIEDEKMPYYSIYVKEPRLEEYELNKMLTFFVNRPKKIDGDIMSELPLSNLHNISNSSRYKPNIWRGSTLYEAPDWVLDKLKEAGIKTIIDLEGFRKHYKKRIKDAGFEYVGFSISSMKYGNVPEFKKEELLKFIKTMQKEYIYMGCECGTYKTDAAIRLNNLFNPKVKGYCKIYSPEMIEYIPQVADEIYLTMTPDDKKSIGWTPEFEKQFNEKIASMLGWDKNY